MAALELDYSRSNTPVDGGKPGHFRNAAGATLDYTLSKRTDVYAGYLFDRLSTEASASSFGVGMRHLF
jgi:predicted porin